MDQNESIMKLYDMYFGKGKEKNIPKEYLHSPYVGKPRRHANAASKQRISASPGLRPVNQSRDRKSILKNDLETSMADNSMLQTSSETESAVSI